MIQIPEDALKVLADEHCVSDAELAALSLALNGQSAIVISKNLGISEIAVRKRLGEVYRKFNIKGSGPGKLAALKRSLDAQHQTLQSTKTQLHRDLHEAIDVPVFYGREEELAKLEQWIVKDCCRLVALLGMGGIGKTALSVKLVKQLQKDFEFVIWRSLRNAPPVENILTELIAFLPKNQQQPNLPETVDDKISLLIDCLRSHRCLLVLDNVESILEVNHRAGYYRKGYEGYGELLRLVGESRHKSCLVLTSREQPNEFVLLEGKKLPVRALQLIGLKEVEGRQIIEDNGISLDNVTKEERQKLLNDYAGNPLALKIVSTITQELFDSDISKFIKEGVTVFDNIRDLLDQQFNRLSVLEKQLMYWLAVNRESVSVSELGKDITPSVSQAELLEALGSLGRRSLISKNSNGFSQVPVIMEYMIDRLIEQICEEIKTGKIELFNSYALMKAQAKDYIKAAQVCLILKPVLDRMLAIFGGERGTEKHLKNNLSKWQKQSPSKSGYTGGNLINLLSQLETDLRGYDFSNITVWQADLQYLTLHDVNFTNANLDKSVFYETLSSILSVAFSSDGTLLATGDVDGEIRLWEVKHGKHVLTCKQKHNSWVRSVAFSPDGKTLASGSGDQTVKLWDVGTGQCRETLNNDTSPVRSVAFSHDGAILASGSDDHVVRLWDWRTCKLLKELKEHTSWVWAVAFSPDGIILASGSDDKSVRLWDTRTGQCLKTFKEHTDWVSSVAFSPDSITLASGSADGTIKLWDVRTGECLKNLTTDDDDISCVWTVAFSPPDRATPDRATPDRATTDRATTDRATTDRAILASGSDDHNVKLWDVRTGECLKILKGHTNRVGSVAFSPADGGTLASGSEDRTVRLWDVKTQQCLKTLKGYSNRVGSVAFSPHNVILASGSDDGNVRLWGVRTGECLEILKGHTNRVGSVAFSPDGFTLASGSDDHTVRLWDVRTGECLKILKGHTNWVSSVAFRPLSTTLASGSDDGTVKLWNVHTGEHVRDLPHDSRLRSVAFSPDGFTLASGSDDKKLRLWDMDTEKEARILDTHNWVWSVAFRPKNGDILASGNDDCTVKLWNVHTEKYLGTLPKEHTNSVKSVAFSPDGQTLASGSDDHTVKLWNVHTEEYLETLPEEHTNSVKSVAFSPDGQTLASGSDDETINLWNVQTRKYLEPLKNKKPYEGMKITGVTGLTDAQKATLKKLGAVEKK